MADHFGLYSDGIEMSYLVLARKWRPQKFSDIVGQDHVSGTLSKAVEKDRLAHAYLFSGPRGCGKTSTARILAKIINCEDPRGGEPCNECDSCRAVIDGEHLDVIEIDGASNRGIDEIRDLREKIGYASSRGKSKIYIIDEVHMLTPQAFNALLKTLEEPPEHVYLILATTEPHKVPATIRSRCQRFNFKRLELAELTGQLERICESEKIGFERNALILISRRADGSMRDAESLLDQCVSAAEGEIDISLVRMVLGLVDNQVVLEILRAVSERDRKAVLRIIDEVVSSGLDLEEFFLAYIEGIRDLLMISEGGSESARWLDLTESEFDEFSSISKIFSTEDLLYIFRSAVNSFRGFKLSGQQRYHLEAAITEAASWQAAVEISDLISGLEREGADGAFTRSHSAEDKTGKALSGKVRARKSREIVKDPESVRGAETGPAAEKKTAMSKGTDEPEKPESETERNISIGGAGNHTEGALEKLGGREEWERFLSRIRETKLTLGIWLTSARVQLVSGGKIVLGFSSSNRFAREMVKEPKNKLYIENHLESFFGRNFAIEVAEIERGLAVPKIEKTEKSPRKKKKKDPALEEILKDEPVFSEVVKEFEGEIYIDDERG